MVIGHGQVRRVDARAWVQPHSQGKEGSRLWELAAGLMVGEAHAHLIVGQRPVGLESRRHSQRLHPLLAQLSCSSRLLIAARVQVHALQ